MKTKNAIKTEKPPVALVHVERMVRRSYNLLEQLHSIVNHGTVWDGDLISKSDRTTLEFHGLVGRYNGGWNAPTNNGVTIARKTRLTFLILTKYKRIKWRIKVWCNSLGLVWFA